MQQFTLLDGSRVQLSELRLDATSYHVYAGARDITNLMRQNDKVIAFPSFSRERDNIRASDEAAVDRGETPPVVGSTSTFVIFWKQIFTEPLKAPIDAVANSFRGLEPQTQTMLKVGALFLAGGMILYGLKLAKDLRNG